MRCHQARKEHCQAVWAQNAKMAQVNLSQPKAGSDVTLRGFDLTMRVVQHMHEVDVLWSVLGALAETA